MLETPGEELFGGLLPMACVALAAEMIGGAQVTATFDLSGGTGFYTLSPCRVADTRGAAGTALIAAAHLLRLPTGSRMSSLSWEALATTGSHESESNAVLA